MALSPRHTITILVGGSLDPLTEFYTEAAEPVLYSFAAPEVERLDCGDAQPLGWLVYGGQEIANEGRTIAYLANRETPLNPSGVPGVSDRWRVNMTPCCPCPVLFTDSDGNATPYLRPDITDITGGGDPAPWYDPELPASAEFLGLLVTSIEGLDSVVTRAVVERGAAPGGAYLGVERQGAREIVVKGTLVATTCAGLDYGRRWLTHTLANDPCDTCDTYALEVRTSCPPDTDPPLSDEGLKTLYGVGLTAGPKRSAPADEHNPCDYLDVEFTLTAGDPWLYDCPVIQLPRTIPAPEPSYDEAEGTFAEWAASFDPPTPFGVTGLVITIETLTQGLSPDALIPEIRVEGYTVEPGQECTTDVPEEVGSAREGEPCYLLTLNDVPRESRLVLDGSRHRFTIQPSNGSEPEEDALPLVVLDSGSSYEWPESTGCLPTCVVVKITATDADRVAVTIETRQRFLA
jgi:hypothetical protein